MKSIELPRGLKYNIDTVQQGTIVPGIDKEPTVTIAVRGGTIQYRLISFVLHRTDTPTWEGDINQTELDDVDSWVYANLPMLFAEAHLHRIIRFDKKAKCYYDFQTQTLYNANGYYEKKGSTAGGLKNVAAINGDPIILPDSAITFIEVLTKIPGVGFETDYFIDESVEDIERAKRTLSQAFYKFLRYDTSIKDTFIKEKTGGKLFKYKGEPQEWFVGEKVQNEILTVKKIYDVAAQQEILTICDPVTGKMVNSVLAEDITLEDSIAFIGLDTGLIDTRLIDIKQFFEANYFEPVDVFKSLLSRCCIMLNTVWEQIEKNIKNNFLHSLSASTYFVDTKEIPHNQSDYFKAYPLNENRLGIVLKNIYPSIIKLIKDYGFEDEFFKDCNLEITSDDGTVDVEKAINGIVSLLLLGLCYCQTAYVDEELDCLKKRYRGALLKLIQEKFDHIPPTNGGDSLFDPEIMQMTLQRVLAFREQLLMEGQYAYVAEIDKIYDDIKKLGYNDENSLLPSSMDRNL